MTPHEMIKILFLAAIPQDITPLQIDEEMRVIDQALRMSKYQERFDLRSHWAVRYSDLQELLLRYKPHIVHFSGHGSAASEIILESEEGLPHPVEPEALNTLFSILKDNLRCVILNACYSEAQARAIAQHIDCVIGMADAIGDTASINFASAFYQALGYGRSIQEAFALGCNAIELAHLPEKAIPQLITLHSDPAQVVLITRERSGQSLEQRPELESPVSAQPLTRTLHNLPTPPTVLIGRTKEMATALALLRREDVWLVTLSGPGGSGKTRLALEIASALVSHFADGVFFVDLAPLQNPDLVLSTIAHTLGLQERSGQSIEERLHHYLQEKQILLLLDNFEQVSVAARLLTELHQYAPKLTLLVTSRARLRLRGEKELPVPPLPLPERGETVETVAQAEAVQLFVERVHDVQSSFVLTQSNAATVAAICTHLDGLPLAIELAAARCTLLSAQALLEGLAEPLDLLTRGPRDLPDRQQTLRATIAWSYNLLTADEQTLFRRLSVFAGGFTLEAVNAVCSLDEGAVGPTPLATLDALASLVDTNLVQQKDIEGELRFHLLETIREYGLEQLTVANEATPLQRCHADYFLNLAATAELYMARREKKRWLEQLQGDYDNLRAALAWLIAADPPAAQQMASALFKFWEARGLLNEGRSWLAKALAADTAPTHTRAWALWAEGHLTDVTVDLQHAQALAQECLLIFHALDDPTGYCEALSLMGYILMNAGQATQALPYLEQCLIFARQSGEPHCLAHALVGVGDVYIALGRSSAQILSLVKECAEIYEELGDFHGLAYTYHVKARLHIRDNDYTQGIALGQEALAINRAMDSRLDVAYVLTNLGGASWFGGDRVAACVYWEEAQQFFQEANDKAMLKEVGYGFAMVACYLLTVAGVTLAQHAFDHTTRLLSVVQKILDNQLPFLDATAQANYREMLTTLRNECLEDTFAALWAEGQRLTLAKTVAFALGLPGASVPLDRPPWLNATQTVASDLTLPDAYSIIKPSLLPSPPRPYPGGLTAREVEVLRLLAQRLTYPQIAEKLIISRRTVNAHITAIYSKLGVNSREAAIRFAVEHHLV